MIRLTIPGDEAIRSNDEIESPSCPVEGQLITARSMTMTRNEVLAVARLARLELDDAAADAVAKDLDRILGYVAKLNELNTDDVEPTAQVTSHAAKLRPDVMAEGLDKAIALSQAPRVDRIGFLVPGFVDES